MPISFGKKTKAVETRLPESGIREALRTGPGTLVQPDKPRPASQARLIDLRHPEVFRAGFIPGSYSLTDMTCLLAARRAGLFAGRSVYLLADDLDQLQLCADENVLGNGVEVAGWFGADAVQEWQKMNPELGSLEVIGSETMAIKLAAWNLFVFDIQCDGEKRALTHPSALRFSLDELPLCLDGLPQETPICLTASTTGVASFAASLLWNFGFHNVSYLSTGRPLRFRPAHGELNQG